MREDSVSDKEDQPTRAHDLDKVDIMNPKTAILDEKELSSGVKPSAGEKGVKKPPKSKLVRSFTPKVPEFAKTSPAAKDKLKLPLMKEFEISLGFGDAFNLGELVKQMALLFLENRKFSESINNNILTPSKKFSEGFTVNQIDSGPREYYLGRKVSLIAEFEQIHPKKLKNYNILKLQFY